MQTVARRALEWPSQKTKGLRQNLLLEKKNGYFILIKGLTHQENITIKNINAPNNTAPNS